MVLLIGAQATAEDDPCVNEIGAVYGLCRAYCVEMDCDDNPNASGTACQSVRDNFLKKTGYDIPCASGGEPTPTSKCPCAEEWRNLVFQSQYTGAPICGYINTEDYPDPGDSSGFILLEVGDWSGGESDVPSISTSFERDADDDDYVNCVSIIVNPTGGGDNFLGGVELRNLYSTTGVAYEQMQHEFYDACFQEILKIADEMGITCQDYSQ
jgi:hypothetical protein